MGQNLTKTCSHYSLLSISVLMLASHRFMLLSTCHRELSRGDLAQRETREAREISLCEIYEILFIIDEDISSLKNGQGSFW